MTSPTPVPADTRSPAQTPRAVRSREVLEQLRTLLPAHGLLFEPEDTKPYECDGLTLFRQIPMIVALPESEAQVVEILKVCFTLGVPVVPRGAGTGLSGGALPHPAGVLLSTAKMNRILNVDPASRTATVEPGVRNMAISEAAAPYRLHYAPDPSSQIACTIGGNVAENSGGVHCLKYGLTVHNVVRVRAVMADGEILEFGTYAPDAPGLDLLTVLIGSEGMLAVTTQVTVRLIPTPQMARCIMASFGKTEDACAGVEALISAGIIPAGLEMLDQAACRLVEPYAAAGYDLEAAAVLLCESDGTQTEVEEEIARMSAVLRGAKATRVQVSASEPERLRFWAGRKSAFPAAGRAAPAYYCMDGTIPRKRLAQLLLAIREMEQRFLLKCPNVFHAGDGNLHPLILFDDGDPQSIRRAEAFGAAILEMCVRLGGTVSGEHGIGVEKVDQMCLQFDLPTLDAFRGIKKAFDPSGILNPDKVIPTLHRCAEYGRMPVHANNLAFPELPRF